MNNTELLNFSKNVRKLTLEILYNSGSSHIGGAYSMVEILTMLYCEVLNISPSTVDDPFRDRFILSKGHACSSLYSVLAINKYFDSDELNNYAQNGSKYLSHASHKINGVEFSSGSLGHGMSIALGLAIGAKSRNEKWKTYCLISDGELNEGSTWEAIMLAPHLKLNNLILIVDYNKIQSLGFVEDVLSMEPISDKFQSFNWDVQVVDGHDFSDLRLAFNEANKAIKPTVIIANTIKGKGVTFMENTVLWHYKSPNKEEYFNALKELN
jgi:transketolase